MRIKRNNTKRYGQWLCWKHFSFQTSISCVNLTCCCATVADFSICFLQLFTDILFTHRSSLVRRTIHWSMGTLTRAAPKLHIRYELWYACGTITSVHTEREESTRVKKEEEETTTNQRILYSTQAFYVCECLYRFAYSFFVFLFQSLFFRLALYCSL